MFPAVDSDMGTRRIARFLGSICVVFCFVFEVCNGNSQHVGRLYPGFQGSRMNWIDVGGVFLVSNRSTFSFGFKPTSDDATLFSLVVIHVASSTVVWTANRGAPVQISDRFMFDVGGNAYLEDRGSVAWKAETDGEAAAAIELQDSGNLALVRADGSPIWQSFSHPTDTLLSGQEFSAGMRLVSDPTSSNLSYFLELESGDLALYSGFRTPQRYWTLGAESRKTVNKVGGEVASAALDANSWKFFGRGGTLLWQFVFQVSAGPNITSALVLGSDGLITFSYLASSAVESSTRIPSSPCGTPEPCEPYNVCSGDNKCRCPPGLAQHNCKTGISVASYPCRGATELVEAGAGLDYFALRYVAPSMRTDLRGCKEACLRNCSCLALFFRNNSQECFMFDQIGSFQESGDQSSTLSYVKVSASLVTHGVAKSQGRIIYVVLIALATVIIIAGLIYGAFSFNRVKQKADDESIAPEAVEEDKFLDGLSGMPTRFSYKDLELATDNFSTKLGQGGFGSVYKGKLSDGSQVAVKKLEGIGQGKKEFRSEVCIIGSIRHVHLVKLRGFCTEGTHRLLAYEYMANGSLEQWIFKNRRGSVIDWDTRQDLYFTEEILQRGRKNLLAY
uniref:Non-specific serine/threonine protein kinase n=1 Tax=Kalanchoe fedtschenkoi TaxID=63787 RepID=A0A7N0VCZ9_KALFE